jgi:hypothetical protein
MSGFRLLFSSCRALRCAGAMYLVAERLPHRPVPNRDCLPGPLLGQPDHGAHRAVDDQVGERAGAGGERVVERCPAASLEESGWVCAIGERGGGQSAGDRRAQAQLLRIP